MESFAQRDKRRECLSLELVRFAYHGGLGDCGMLDERRLHFHGPDSMPGDVEHVVDPTENPVVAAVVALGAVGREIETGATRPLGEVCLHVSVVVAPNRA